MKRKILSALFFLYLSSAFSAVNDNGDIQLWVQEQTSLPITHVGMLFFDAESRIGNEASQLYYVQMQAISLFPITHYLEMGPGYRQIWRQKRSTFKPIFEPEFDAILKTKTGKVKLLNRNRFSYRFVDDGQNSAQYRLLVKMSFDYSLSPFLSNEFFFDNHRDFFQNRLAAGISTPIIKNVKINTFYLLRSLKSFQKWNLNHVFGLYLKMAF